MRITINIPDEDISRIDEEANSAGFSRTSWIHQACMQALNTEASERHQGDDTEVISLRVRCEYQEAIIIDLKEQIAHLRGDVAQWQGVAGAFKELIPGRQGILTRIRGYLIGPKGDE